MRRPARRRILIVGGGFGGLHLIRRLEGRLRPDEAEVTLVDRQNFHLFTPLLYQVATGELPEHAVAYPLRRAAVHARARFLQTEVESIDIEGRSIRTADGPLAYDHLVLAPGAVTNDFGIPGVREHALPMKTLADAKAVRRRILTCFERAASTDDPALRKRLLTFILIDGSDRVIPAMHPRLSAIAQQRLDTLRVRTVLKTFVSEVADGIVLTKEGARFLGDTVVWAGGVKAHPLIASLDGVSRAKDGRLVVDGMFRVGGRDDLFCVGDAAAYEHRGKVLAQLAQVAVLEAPHLADDLVRLVRGEPLVPYVHHAKGDLIALGRTSSGAHMRRLGPLPTGDLVFGGLPAWTVWRGNYLMQLLGVRNRASLLTEWVLSFFFSRMVANTP